MRINSGNPLLPGFLHSYVCRTHWNPDSEKTKIGKDSHVPEFGSGLAGGEGGVALDQECSGKRAKQGLGDEMRGVVG